MSHCFLNGKFVPLSKAAVSVHDIGILRGFGFFEAFRTYNRKPFRVKDHLARLKSASSHFNIRIPLSDAVIAHAINTLVTKNVPKNKEASIRIVLTGGRAINTIEPSLKAPTLYILVEEYRPLSRKYYRNGCSLLPVAFERQFPEYKTTNYIEAVSLQKKRKKVGALEILYTANGFVYECSTSNIFIVRRNVLITPQNGILEGITRRVVLEEATRVHIRTQKRNVSVRELYEADEMFITSSFKEVVPVVRVGGRRIGNGTVGPTTKRVMELFHSATLYHKNHYEIHRSPLCIFPQESRS